MTELTKNRIAFLSYYIIKIIRYSIGKTLIWLEIPVFCGKIYLTQMKGIGGVFMIKIAIVDDEKIFVSCFQKDLKRLFQQNKVTCIIASVGTAFVNGIIYVMCAESIDYGEWKSGIRVQGFLMAFIGFAVKIANSIVQMITTAILNAGGYNGAAEVQTASAVNAIEFCYVWIPVILFVIVFIINGFYKLDKIYPQIRADLNKKRDAMATEN